MKKSILFMSLISTLSLYADDVALPAPFVHLQNVDALTERIAKLSTEDREALIRWCREFEEIYVVVNNLVRNQPAGFEVFKKITGGNSIELSLQVKAILDAADEHNNEHYHITYKGTVK